MLNSTLNGLRSCNILKYTDNLVQSTECLSLTPCHEKSPLTPCHGKTPLTPCHGLTCSKNSLTPCHELYRCNLATSSKFSIAIAIVNAGKISPVITLPMSRMYARSQAVKRARPSSSTRASSSSQHSGSSSSYKEPARNPNITLTNRALQDSEMRENKYRDKICNMCSDSTTSRYHHHFSSWNIRRMFLNMKVKDDTRTYMCPICHDPELVVVPASETRRIVLCDRTMYGIWNHKTPKGVIHFDIDSIVGGKVADLKLALQKNYLHMPNRCEILVIAGLNDIGVGQKADQIISDMREIREVVKDHSDRWGHGPPSYVTFCTVPYAPKFSSLQVPPSPPEPEIAAWAPPKNFRNKYEEIKSLNDKIISLNKEIDLTGVRMDYQGIKRFKSGMVQHIFDTKLGSAPVWREGEVFKKLHFVMEKKLKMAIHISTCFKENSERIKGRN